MDKKTTSRLDPESWKQHQKKEIDHLPSAVQKYIRWLMSEKKFSEDKALWFYNLYAGKSNGILTYEEMVEKYYERLIDPKKRTSSRRVVREVDPSIKAKKLGCKHQFPECPDMVNASDCAGCPFFPK